MADLKILARMTNLVGDEGRAAIPTFTESNFAPVPEPSGMLLMSCAAALGAAGFVRRRRRTRG
jgi:hypothetical protein